MSLESLAASARRINGAFVLLQRPDEKLVVFQLPNEDMKKQEGDIEDDALTWLEAGMVSTISGGIEDEKGETSAQAVVREAREERRIILSASDLLKLPFTTDTVQWREGKLARIAGTGYTFPVSDRLLHVLESRRRKTGVIVATPAELLFDSKYPLRPFMKSVVKKLLGTSV